MSFVEVGDEEREILAGHIMCDFEFDQEISPIKPCPLCQRIRVLIRQKRMMSREQIEEWGRELYEEARFIGSCRPKLKSILSDLGYEIVGLRARSFYITFGQIHVHSIEGKTFDKDCVAKIQEKDFDKAREKAMIIFKGKFCFLYEEIPDMSYYPRGIIEI